MELFSNLSLSLKFTPIYSTLINSCSTDMSKIHNEATFFPLV